MITQSSGFWGTHLPSQPSQPSLKCRSPLHEGKWIYAILVSSLRRRIQSHDLGTESFIWKSRWSTFIVQITFALSPVSLCGSRLSTYRELLGVSYALKLYYMSVIKSVWKEGSRIDSMHYLGNIKDLKVLLHALLYRSNFPHPIEIHFRFLGKLIL